MTVVTVPPVLMNSFVLEVGVCDAKVVRLAQFKQTKPIVGNRVGGYRTNCATPYTHIITHFHIEVTKENSYIMRGLSQGRWIKQSRNPP